MTILVLLPDHLLSRLRIAVGRRATIVVATALAGRSGVADVLDRGRVDLLIIDPTDRRLEGHIRSLAALLDRFPSVPVLVYTALAMPGIRQAMALSRSGPRDFLVAGWEDQPTAIRAFVARLAADVLAERLLERIGSSLARLSPRVTRAIRMLFTVPARFRAVEDIAAAAGITRRHLSRELSRAGLARGWHFLVIARVLRTYRLLRWEPRSLASAAAHLRVAPRILARHIRLITGVTRTVALLSLHEDELVTCCVRALQRATPEPPDTTRRARL